MFRQVTYKVKATAATSSKELLYNINTDYLDNLSSILCNNVTKLYPQQEEKIVRWVEQLAFTDEWLESGFTNTCDVRFYNPNNKEDTLTEEESKLVDDLTGNQLVGFLYYMPTGKPLTYFTFNVGIDTDVVYPKVTTYSLYAQVYVKGLEGYNKRHYTEVKKLDYNNPNFTFEECSNTYTRLKLLLEEGNMLPFIELLGVSSTDGVAVLS